MNDRFDSLHPLLVLVDEASRLSGRLKTVFAKVRRSVGLGESEMMVLTAVVESERPPTVPQIGRSLGQPRQIVQRAANALEEGGLIETLPNPDHKRAMLLRTTAAGLAVKRRADAIATGIAENIAAGMDLAALNATVRDLGAIRKQLETALRERDG